MSANRLPENNPIIVVFAPRTCRKGKRNKEWGGRNMLGTVYSGFNFLFAGKLSVRFMKVNSIFTLVTKTGVFKRRPPKLRIRQPNSDDHGI